MKEKDNHKAKKELGLANNDSRQEGKCLHYCVRLMPHKRKKRQAHTCHYPPDTPSFVQKDVIKPSLCLRKGSIGMLSDAVCTCWNPST